MQSWDSPALAPGLSSIIDPLQTLGFPPCYSREALAPMLAQVIGNCQILKFDVHRMDHCLGLPATPNSFHMLHMLMQISPTVLGQARNLEMLPNHFGLDCTSHKRDHREIGLETRTAESPMQPPRRLMRRFSQLLYEQDSAKNPAQPQGPCGWSCCGKGTGRLKPVLNISSKFNEHNGAPAVGCVFLWAQGKAQILNQTMTNNYSMRDFPRIFWPCASANIFGVFAP